FREKNMDQRPFGEAIAGKYVHVRHPETLAEDIQLAFRFARSGQGPVIFAVPLDMMIGKHDLEWEYSPGPVGNPERQRIRPDSEAIARAAAILGEAERTAIVVGRGALESQADEEICVLAERTGALLLTTLLARGYLSHHPQNAGLAGLLGTDATHSLLSECDCVVAVGCSLNPDTTEHGLLFPEARIIHIDRNPGQIGNYLPASAGILGDARVSLGALNSELTRQGFQKKRGFWNKEASSLIADSKLVRKTTYAESPDTIDPRQLVAEMDRMLPKERIVSVDGGHCMLFVAPDISLPSPKHFLWTQGFGSIGLGLYQGIGAAVGRPDQHVAVFAGDGGFMMSVEELDTAVRHRIPMTVIVMNDNGFGAEVHQLEARGRPVNIALYNNPDFAQVGKAFGAVGFTVRKLEDLRHVAAQIGKGDLPVLIDAKTNPTVVHELFMDMVKRPHTPHLTEDLS
ncbi:MAG: thiamine pyrophosphate-dependent enzyme, partial [Pseudomonadota bacterium]